MDWLQQQNKGKAINITVDVTSDLKDSGHDTLFPKIFTVSLIYHR